MGRNNFTISDFYCIRCGAKGMPLPRKMSKQKEGGHMKKLYCLSCKCEVNHVEVRPFGEYSYDNFKEDFNNGKFKDIELPTQAVCSGRVSS